MPAGNMMFDTSAADERAHIAQEEAARDARVTDLESRRAQALQSFDERSTPMEQDLQGEMAQPLPEAPTPTQLPAPPGPIVDSKQYQGLAFALLGAALIGGATSHGNWMGALSSLNGAMKGMKEGRDAQAKQQMDDYDRKFQAAKAHDEQANKVFLDILNSRKLSINDKMERLKVEAARYDRQDLRFAAEQRSIDMATRQIDAQRSALNAATQRHDSVIVHVEAAQQAAEKRRMGGGMGPQTDAGRELAAALMERGMPVSYFGGKGKLYDTMAADPKYAGKSADQIAGEIQAGKASGAAYATAMRQTEVARAGTERITSSITNIEDKVVEVAKRVGLTDSKLINIPANKLRDAFGSKNLAELEPLLTAVSREYARAVTQPGSNAALTQGAQDHAMEMLNKGMSIGQLLGAMKGMNEDIAAGKAGMESIEKDLNTRIRGIGMGGAPGASKPTVSGW